MFTTKLKVGDLVEVRSKEEILSTLDRDARLEGLPFMPQMFEYCGKTFRVFKRAHKTCDTVGPRGCSRSMVAAVHLEELRCDGAAYGGCQAGCLLFWKEAWLKPVGKADRRSSSGAAGRSSGCSEEDVMRGTRAPDSDDEDVTYVCQATYLPEATTYLPWWDVRQYLEDYLSGNAGLRRLINGLIYSVYYKLSRVRIRGVYRVTTWLYDQVQKLIGGSPYPRKRGWVPPGQRTPKVVLNLHPGERVRIKSYDEILDTLDHDNANRGMVFDGEQVPYCGGTYRVKGLVEKIVDEKTGKMLHFKSHSVILDGVYCRSRYSNLRMFCPRAIYPFWREAWLERVEDEPAAEPDA